MSIVFEGVKGYKLLDYVAAWYIKAAQYIQGYKIKVAFVSTNSITQGEQVSILWNELYNNYNIKIHFVHKTFKWTNEAWGNAGVYVVIIGFAAFDSDNKRIYEYEKPTSYPHEIKVKNINPYLVEGDDLIVLKRSKPLSDVPKMIFGSKPVDDGNLILNDEEKDILIKIDPDSEKFIRPMISNKEYLYNKNRWALWLINISPQELRQMPEVIKRVKRVREFRLRSNKKKTVESADTPTEFAELRQPDTDFIVIPLHTSGNRKYIPLSFFPKDYIVNNSISCIPNADLYHFGVLSSIMHMTWMIYTAGRLKGDYRYSGSIVYNNFPWPVDPSNKLIQNIKDRSQKILDIRNEFQINSLADLYDPIAMPTKLTKAHRKLDKAVDNAYGKKFDNNSQRMKFLFELYEEYINK
jgi:hypothetical protein